ncbi:MAG: NAD+ synthase [Bdellovibrionota bacterium]
MKIAIAQIDPIVGAFDSNIKKIKISYERACQAQARLLLTPEMGVCGYPQHDLIDRPEMLLRNEAALDQLAALTLNKSCALAVGHVSANPLPFGRKVRNTVTILEGGKRVYAQSKSLLPTYDVFDETRYFEPAQNIEPWVCDGIRIGVAICEDLWATDPVQPRPLYDRNPVDTYLKQEIKMLISLSASPYEWAKRERREKLHSDIAKKLGVPLVYVNQVGATDEILFDGGSFALLPTGESAGRLPFFQTSFGVLNWDSKKGLIFESPEIVKREDKNPEEIELLCRGLVSGVREYFSRNGFKKAIIGLSGGIDSAVACTLITHALGPENVLGVAMPSQFSSSHSLEDAEILAKNLKIRLEVRPIKFLFSTASRELSERRGGQLNPVASENLQSRLRGMTLMTFANHDGALVITTGNKSELATGYCTLYGDAIGALAPLGDLFKTRVYQLARFMNQLWGAPIPERSIAKAPSAELKPNQTDQDTLPPYEALDALLEDYIENLVSVDELIKKFGGAKGAPGPHWVTETLRRLEINEYKRRQAPPVLKVSRKAFGIGRRIPISKNWDQ